MLNDTPLAETKEENDLGVWTTNTLKSLSINLKLNCKSSSLSLSK